MGVGAHGPLGPGFHHVGEIFKDRNFWYANSNFILSPPFTGEATANGFIFKGKKTYDGGSLLKLGFGVVSRYVLDAHRIPRPERGPWRSSPRFERFGHLMGSTTNESGNPFAGDQWSKCWMIKRQTLWQTVFGPPGADNRRKVGENIQVEQLIFLEGTNKFGEKQLMPGWQPMPEVIVGQIFPGVPIVAELEVRFDIQLEGGSTMWITNDIVVRKDQWPLVPM